MDKLLQEDLAQFDKVLMNVVVEANRFLSELNTMPAGATLPAKMDPVSIPDEGFGALRTLDYFRERYASLLSSSPAAILWSGNRRRYAGSPGG